MKIPKLLKIISKEVLNKISYESLNLFSHIRLRDISYSFYKKHIKEKLLEFNFNGNLIIDYPHNIDWLDKYYGIHYKSCFIRNVNYQKKKTHYYIQRHVTTSKTLNFVTNDHSILYYYHRYLNHIMIVRL